MQAHQPTIYLFKMMLVVLSLAGPAAAQDHNQASILGERGISAGHTLEHRPSVSSPDGSGTPRGVPAIDDCAAAETIVCGNTYFFDNTLATTSPSDPGFSCHGGGAGTQGVGTVWYKFVATNTETRLVTCSSVAPADDSLIALYSVGNMGDPCNTLTEIACSEDDCGPTGLLGDLCVTGLIVDDTYYVQVAAWDESDRGQYTLEFLCACSGGCCHPDDTCDVTTEADCPDLWLGPDIDCTQCPCDQACDPGATPEGEPVCVNSYDDLFNGGCNSDPEAFWSIVCGQTVCGAAGTFLGPKGGTVRDTDWYELLVTEEAIVTWTVTAGFPSFIGFVQTTPPGSGDCATMTGSLSPYAYGAPCTPDLVSALVGPGTYWLYAAPRNQTGVPCVTEYNAQVTCLPAADNCNQNSQADDVDLSSETSEDCDSNAVPDECDGTTYSLDDGSHENGIGLSGGGDIIWLNQFNVLPGGETIWWVSLAWGSVPNGVLTTVLLYDDPNNDGDPVDAVLLTTTAVNTANTNTDFFTVVPVAPTFVGNPGDSFFVGAFVSHPLDTFPASIDQTLPSQLRSWVAGGDAGTGDINNLSNNELLGLIDSFGLPGNWLIRAVASDDPDCNGNGERDTCDIAEGTSQDNNANGILDECETVAAARAAGVGVEVTVGNVVISSATDLIASVNSKNFHIQDATGGITVFGNNANVDSLLALAGEGDSITINAFTGSFNGLFELVLSAGPFSLTNDGAVGIPDPISVAVADFQDFSPTAEGYESMLVKLSGVTFEQSGTFLGLTDYTVTDGSQSALVRIATNDLDLVGATIPCGQIDITGVFNQFDVANLPTGTPGEVYQLLPRSIADIVFLDCNSNGIPDDCDIANCDGELACLDCNGNAIPDGCEPDADKDEIIDDCDICPTGYDPKQEDEDGDAVGDVCDNCPSVVNSDQLDLDADGRGDVCDNCPNDPNPAQADTDADGIGDVCEGLLFDFFEPFEAYPDQAAFELVWPDTGNSEYYLDLAFGNPGQSLAMPSPSANFLGRYTHNLGTDVGGAGGALVVFRYDLWLDPGGQGSSWFGARHYAELRGYSGDAFEVGDLENLLAIGVMNQTTPPDIFDATRYQGRLWSSVEWQTLDEGSAPNRLPDWHEMMIRISDTEVRFFVDGTLSETEVRPNAFGFDSVILGSILTANGHAMALDNVRVQVFPDCNGNGLPDGCDLDCAAQGGTCALPGCGLSQDCNTNEIPDECDIADCIGDPECGDCNSNTVPDECDISNLTSDDCNTNGIPDECELADCAGQPACDDCNLNDIIDECDIADLTSDDCNSNGIPDECELAGCVGDPDCDDCNSNGILDECDIADCLGDTACGDCNNNSVPDWCDINDGTEPDVSPPDGIPDRCSEFVGGGTSNPSRLPGQLWSDPNNWYPVEAPDNGAVRTFSVNVLQSTDIVLLDMQSTIDTLILGTDAVVNMTDVGDLTIATSDGILIDGRLIIGADRTLFAAVSFDLTGESSVQLSAGTASVSSTDPANVITNWATIEGEGVIDANLVNMGTILANTAATVLSIEGPNAKTNNGIFEATNGATLLVTNVAVTGTGSYRADGGTIQLLPGGTPTSITGSSMEITSSALVEVNGDAAISLTESMTVTDGGSYQGTAGSSAGLITGDLLVSGAANGGEVLLSELMTLEATGAVVVDGSSWNCLGIQRGCTPPRLRLDGSLSRGGSADVTVASLVVLGNNLISASGLVELDGGTLVVNGPLIVDAGGVIQSTGLSSVTLEVESLAIQSSGLGGQVLLLDLTTLNVTGDLAITSCPGSRLGCTPPELGMMGQSNVTVGGDLFLSGAVEVHVQATTTFELAGNFDNQATNPDALLFDWESGPMTMNGITRVAQTFELAGELRGPNPSGFIDNFAMGTLRIEAGSTVDFVDNFDNFAGPGCEALYVHTLSLGAGALVRLINCHVYYDNLIDEGATVESVDGGALVCINPGDVNCDGIIDLDDGAVLFGVLLGSDPDPAHVAAGDLNGDGSTDGNDIQLFLDSLLAP